MAKLVPVTKGRYKSEWMRLGVDAASLIETFASDLVKTNAAIIQRGIATGNANAGEGLLFTMVYTDLLHGGAYRWDFGPNKLPYTSLSVQQQIGASLSGSTIVDWFEGLLGVGINITIPDGYAGAGLVVAIPPGASQNWMEAVINGFVPRILPKLLSDQTYAAVMDRCGQLLNITEFSSLGTGIKTYVEAGTELIGALEGGPAPARTTQRAKATQAAAMDADTTIG